MGRLRWAILLAGLALGDGAALADGGINVFVGQKGLDSDWAELDEQAEYGIEGTFSREGWPVRLVAGYLFSEDDAAMGGESVDGSTFELGLGIRKIWGKKHVHPFIGGGLAMLNGEAELTGPGGRVEDDDRSLGGWVDGGVFWTMGGGFALGLELRLSTGEVEVFGTDLEVGGNHYAVTIGWEF